MKKLFFNFRLWLSWRNRIKNKQIVDWRRGCGYYLDVYRLEEADGRIEECKLPSDRIGIYKLIGIDYFSNPPDMIENSYWQLLGYKGQKLFKDMTFNEYKESRLHLVK